MEDGWQVRFRTALSLFLSLSLCLSLVPFSEGPHKIARDV